MTVLMLALSAVPAFASSQNHSNEKHIGNQYFTQGKSKSDPDNNEKGPERNNGKSDKPGSNGGLNKSDQDGNNGCGNDLDREDDNEGWCGQKPKNSTEKNEDKDKDNDKVCTKDKDKEVEETKPVVTTPQPTIVVTASAPQVAGASTVRLLPNTATADDSNYNLDLLIVASLVASGLGMYFVSRKINVTSNAKQ